LNCRRRLQSNSMARYLQPPRVRGGMHILLAIAGRSWRRERGGTYLGTVGQHISAPSFDPGA